ncbi:GPN-loop GTPase 3-like [Styela clava]|uniref:GPN-loop GTPase 3-like n=1 Tax=Styela clava TaxID=7725 RepID=UPI001939DF86|nr:GPN-loop GTPase 3-like [Styela clava]
MPRYAQLVMGPAGSGKSTYCSMMVEHFSVLKRKCYVVNLDPAAEYFDYPVELDIRELIHLDDVMEDEELRFGPNGGLVFCMEYFAKNMDWIKEFITDMEEDSYFLFDCPGQIELYTHLPVMKTLVENLQNWDFRTCGVFLVDSQFLGEPSKFISGTLSSLSCMINLEITHLSVMTKVDLLSKHSKRDLQKFLDPEMQNLLLADMCDTYHDKKYQKLTESLCQIIDDYSMVRFLPLDRSDEESINIILQHIDTAMQFSEDQPVRVEDYNEDNERDAED